MKRALKVLSLLGLIFSLVIVSWKGGDSREKLSCNKVGVQVDTQDDLYFITQEMVLDSMRSNEDSLLGKPLEDINIYLLEEFVDANENIEKAELYLTITGELHAEVKQRKPVLRVFEGENSYYLDENLSQFPLSENYSARVKLLYWSEATEERKVMLVKLLDAIESDDFMDAQLSAIEFDEMNQIVLYPRVGEQKIILGEAIDIEKKFEKLKIFYQQGLEKIGWDRYSLINLKYKDQLVCTKR